VSLPRPPSLDQLCEQALQLPCSPAVLPRLMAAVDEEHGTAAEIESIIQVDSALAAATLRLANSVFFGARQSVSTLSQAVLLLGHAEIYRLASLSLISRWENLHHEALPWEPGDYARHSLCTALAAEVIAEAHESTDPHVAYTAGLVGDLGKLVLAFGCASFYPEISAQAALQAGTWEEAERAVLGYDHAQVGARLLRAWRFPEIFAQATAWQFQPREAPPEAVPLLAQLHAAKYVAVSLGAGVTEGGFLFALQGSFLTEWGFTTEFLEEALLEVRDRAFRRMGDRLSVGLFKG
jgi:HD-like signal output (HDOD) protein